jgi:iron complex outermembrane receptor protein
MTARALILCWVAASTVVSVPSGALAQVQAPGVGDGAGEILVTARRREETLVDVPISITALSGAQLAAEGIESANDLFGRVPSLYFTKSGGAAPSADFTYLTMRGVGFNGGQEPAVGFFIDGMYQPQLGFDLSFLDLERVEILRGPQGTLFGRNTQAGAISLITKRPGDTFEGRAEAEAGQFGTFRALASVRAPISESFGVALAGEYRRTDGFVTNSATGDSLNPDERFSLRGALRFRPSDSLDIYLAGDISRQNFNDLGYGIQLTDRAFTGIADNDLEDRKDNDGIQLNIDWKVSDSITLTSITGYRSVRSEISVDSDGLTTNQTPFVANGRPGSTVAPNPIIARGVIQTVAIEQDFWSQELRLAGSMDRIDWLVGGYYFDQDQNQKRDFDIGNVATVPATAILARTVIREDFDTGRSGWAAFAQASWRPIERVEISGGLRYSDEEVTIGGERLRNITQIENANPTFFTLDDSERFSDLTWMGSVSFDVSQSVRAYASASKGWRAGGFNRFPSQARAAIPYDSETSINYELGLKGNVLDNTLGFALAVFQIDIEGQQLLTVTPDDAGIPVTTIANAGKSRSRGFEAELNARPTDGLNVDFGIGYTDGRFVDFLQCSAANNCISRDGDVFETVPEWTISAGIAYTVPLGDRNALELSARYQFVDSVVLADGSSSAPLGSQLTVPAWDNTDLRASFKRDGWRLTAYVTNLFDVYSYETITHSAFGTRTPNNLLVRPRQPRTFGAVAEYRF